MKSQSNPSLLMMCIVVAITALNVNMSVRAIARNQTIDQVSQSEPKLFSSNIIEAPALDSDIYFPIANCSHSRTKVGDTIVVTVPRLFVRSDSDNHPADNIIGYIYRGDRALITGSPECSWGWIMWPVKVKGQDLEGWIAESKGEEFWFTPVNSHHHCPDNDS